MRSDFRRRIARSCERADAGDRARRSARTRPMLRGPRSLRVARPRRGASCQDTGMASTSALPVRIGLLYDFPQRDDLFAKAMRLGIDDVAATGRLDRGVELVERQAEGVPSGAAAEGVPAFREVCAA